MMMANAHFPIQGTVAAPIAAHYEEESIRLRAQAGNLFAIGRIDSDEFTKIKALAEQFAATARRRRWMDAKQ